MKELKGAPVSAALMEKCKADVAVLGQKGIVPKLAVVRIGGREDDLAYEAGIKKRFAAAGAVAEVAVLPPDVPQETLERTIDELNRDGAAHGILVFRPLPKHLSEERIKRVIAEEKDVDCMGGGSMAHVFMGDGMGYPPCTPQAVMELLDFYRIDVAGKRVVVVGRSLVVGKPLSMLLLGRNATVTVCHTKTQDLPSECRRADILVACAGKAKMITGEYVRAGQIVIDVGINMLDGRLCGDVDYAAVADQAEAVTPVPGGVGTVTTSVLLKHTVRGAMMKGKC
jgi:methylenetetrahydrofolate dehydrogenase (NADP+)/methenyltetrahydrofolate cyclohydrolase